MNVSVGFAGMSVTSMGSVGATSTNFAFSSNGWDGMAGVSYKSPIGFPLLMQILKDQG